MYRKALQARPTRGLEIAVPPHRVVACHGAQHGAKWLHPQTALGLQSPRPQVLRHALGPLATIHQGRSGSRCAASKTSSNTTAFIDTSEALLLPADSSEEGDEVNQGMEMQDKLATLRSQAQQLSKKIDELYNQCFAGLSVTLPSSNEPREEKSPEGTDVASGPTEVLLIDSMTEARFSAMGREQPQVLAAVLSTKQDEDPEGWTSFQAEVRPLKLQRTRIEREAEELLTAIQTATQKAATRMEAAARLAGAAEGGQGIAVDPNAKPVRIVLITGFESFNVDLYKQVAKRVRAVAPHITLQVFSDRELQGPPKAKVEAALDGADVLFASLIFDYDQVEWLRERIAHIPVRLVFESALELMSCTQVGSFSMAPSPSGAKQGPPPIVKKVLSLFGSQREEDKMVGYLSFLKVGPQLLKWVPGKKAADIKHWLTIYGYWNQGGVGNVLSMVLYLVDSLVAPLNTPGAPAGVSAASLITPPVETPPLGCLHPAYKAGRQYFNSPAQYWAWYQKEGPLRGTAAPVVGLLLYRKHVITDQPYILQLIEQMEQEGIIPVPVFINGVEAHTVVRDLFTSTCEQAALAQGRPGGISPTLARDAVRVDAVVSTIGFPLVGGPAGSMEAGRQADVAKTILTTKNIPYTVAAPLLIQDMASWSRDGIAGLQSVVLYSLPELDGAIDTVPLGGLVGDNIYLVPERVKKMAGRIKGWVNLRRKPVSERQVAVLLYGFPPGVGAVGTAALLNVPKSLHALLQQLKAAGYDLGDVDLDALDGEALVAALTGQDAQRAVSRGAAGIEALGAGEAEAAGVQAVGAEVTPAQLKSWLTYPPEWGPSEWGPIPYLPDNDILVKRMEKQWGDLRTYRGIMTSAAGNLVVPGLKIGNVFIGVQPLLGVEGDPMRLLFERDLTPHPQYAAFYKWLQHEMNSDVVLHFGMHGTVEWLPGAPLGNTGLSWSDVLLGEMPNVYVYACNNPSESIIAKRRGYGTIISHNVPPYGRAGLYKQLATLKDLIAEWREAQAAGGGAAENTASAGSRSTIFSNIQLAGLQDDVPFYPGHDSQLPALAAAAAAAKAAAAAATPHPAAAKPKGSSVKSSKSSGVFSTKKPGSQDVKPGGLPFKATKQAEGSLPLTPELVEEMSEEEWGRYLGDVYAYLQVLENRLFSEGLHVLGAPPTRSAITQYLNAYFDDQLPEQAIEAVADAVDERSLDKIRSDLERTFQQPSGSPAAASSDQQVSGEVLATRLQEALTIRNLLRRNTEELTNVLKAMSGEFIPPEAGGDLLRDGPGVLPTGRNIHALDPYRMPSPTATERGAAAAQAILDAHTAANNGAYPETVAINLWGLDAIKTKGESVAMVLHMVGAQPVREGTGRMARYELIPLEQLGRPRVDVLCNMSGIFRDSFQNVVELLDDLFQRAADADEPPESNFIKKHSLGMKAKGMQGTAARLFSNPAGDYGSMVNERVGASNWENGDELGDTWAARNAFSYGRGGERGTARPEVLDALLSTTQQVVQQIDSVEYGLTDIQEYYANTGALARAASKAGGGKPVGVSIVEAFGKDPTPRQLDEVLRLEYRSKFLNPKWAEAMVSQGSGGAYEISQRMTAMVGWGATTGFSEGWAWDQAASTYALDPEMAEKLRKANPQAFNNVVKRLLEASGRGMWAASPDVVARLRSLYSEMDDQLEGVGKASAPKN